jgi:hypothetical protein
MEQVLVNLQVLMNVKALPGVESAAFTLCLPIAGSAWGSAFIAGDQPVPERLKIPTAAFNPVSPDIFKQLESNCCAEDSLAKRTDRNHPKCCHQ